MQQYESGNKEGTAEILYMECNLFLNGCETRNMGCRHKDMIDVFEMWLWKKWRKPEHSPEGRNINGTSNWKTLHNDDDDVSTTRVVMLLRL